MRHVVKTNEVAHLWAHRVQSDARNPKYNFYFEGDTIYSYGSHFPIARHVEYKGRKAILLTTRGYSNTTSGHICDVRRAIPFDAKVIKVSNPASGWSEQTERKRGRDEQIKTVADAAKRVAESRRGRSRELRMEAYAIAAQNANAYFEFFGYTRRYDPGIDADELAERGKAEVEAERKRNAAETRKQIARFRSGEKVMIRHNDSHLLRVDGDQVVTSLGATVPLEHVKKALPIVLACVDKGRTYQRNGHTIHLGHYAIDKIDAKGTLTAGCHRILKGEIKRLAAEVETA